MIDISVVMPVYNGEENLAEAIESIINQTFRNFEFIIICEYGTNEESIKIVREFADKDSRIVAIFNKERLGISASMNVGLRLAKGKYIARMDADDVSGEKRFEIQIEYMNTYPEIGVCGIMHSVINAKYWLLDYHADPEQIRSDLLFFVPLRHPTIMIRSDVVKKYGIYYSDSLPGVEDYDFYIRASRVTKLSNINEKSLFAYRWSCNNASIVYKQRDKEIKKKLMGNLFKEELNIEFSEEELDALVINTCFDNTNDAYFSQIIKILDDCLIRIFDRNVEVVIYDSYALEQTLIHRWQRLRYNMELRYDRKVPKHLMDKWSQGRFYRVWIE